ncbi:SpoIIE family protein phosphatase [Streptomyces aidingensis]|uniref:SpoIIE family protein phosphatase n=1 Tax=Streptomyces aidingensis TaxID=910347 RepID=UPI00158748B8|nr:SpoIIE family protein phosphatase [Streptomyces aidingensis]
MLAAVGVPMAAPPDPGTTSAASLADWPAGADVTLTLNRIGRFDWDLDHGLMHLDRMAEEVFDLEPGRYAPTVEDIGGSRLPPTEGARLDAVISHAIKDHRPGYGSYIKIRRRDGELRWTHIQGHILRDAADRPYRIIGVVRDVSQELAQPPGPLTLESHHDQQSQMVEETTAALAYARTVQDVLDVLHGSRGLGRLGVVSLILGFVEGSHIRQVAEGHEGSIVPELELTRISDNYPLSEVVRTLSPRWIRSRREFAESYPSLWPHIAGLDVTSAAYLPLIAQGRPIGAIGLLFKGRRVFHPADRTLITALTSAVAQSVQRAKLYDQGRELAESLQRAMLPHSVPEIAGMRAAVSYRSSEEGRDIGGDWYDVIRLPGGRVAAVIGDVQGHDTHAAAVMGQLRIVLRAYAAEGLPASIVMVRASAFLRDLDTDRFATCLYAEADPASGRVGLVRAGHLDPLLWPPGGECHSYPVLGALPLGLGPLSAAAYPMTSLEMVPGETLLMFTDGLVERRGTDLEEGVRALAAAVPRGPEDLDELAAWLCRPTPGREGEGQDDAAMVLLRR